MVPSVGVAMLAAAMPVTAAEVAPAPRVFNVRDYGATGDGATADTAALQMAIDEASKAGGGIVRLPGGRYLTGSLDLKSRITLQIDTNAVLLGSPRKPDYRRLDMKGRLNFHALLLAYRQKDISIVGGGTIDGQGTALAADTKRMAQEGAIPDATEIQRPMIVHFRECSGVTVRDVELRNSACWVQEYRNCDGLRIENIRVRSIAALNNDGIDIDGCSNAVVRGCDIDAEDDGICLKSVERPCDRVLVERCRVRSSCNAIKFGTASEKGFRNIVVRDMEVYDTYLSGVALEIVDGGLMENVRVSRIRITGSHNAIFIRLGHRNVKGEVGTLRDVVLEDIVAEIPVLPAEHMTKFPFPDHYHHPTLITSSITGQPGHPVKDVTLRNISIVYGGIGGTPPSKPLDAKRLDQVPEKADAYPESRMFGQLPAWGFYCRHADGLTFENVVLRVQGKDYRPAVVCDDVRNIRLDGFQIRSAGSEPPIVLKDVDGATIRRSEPPAGADPFVRSMGATRNVQGP